MLNNIKTYVISHKILSICILIVVFFIGKWGYQKYTSTALDTRYITTKVTKDTIIASVSGSGQVSALSQVDIKSKVSGDVSSVLLSNGSKVHAGEVIMQIDSKNAQKSIRDAEINLESATLALEKLKIQNSNENVNANLSKAYDDGFNTVSEVFLNLSSTIAGLQDILNNKYISDYIVRASGKTAQDYKSTSETYYYNAKNSFETNSTVFKTLNHNSNKADIENIVNKTYETTKLVSDAINNLSTLINYVSSDTGQSSNFVSLQNTISSYTSSIHTNVSSLLSAQANIKSNKDALPNASLDIQSSILSVQMKKNALQDAKDALADYTVRAPFDGTIAVVNVKKTDSVSSSTTVATLITKNQIAEVSLNEVDVAKIKVGQKATLTFDAIPELSISGSVAEIDSIGTASQGVVTYNVKISFDTQDDRIKPSMSVSADIVTDIKQDVLAIPNSAVKSQGGTKYIEMFDSPLPLATDGLLGTISKIAPNKVEVTTGLSNDSKTEILSGLQEGQEIVTRTILPTTGKATAAAPSIFGGGGARTGTAGR